MIHEIGETDQHRRQTDQTVQDRYQLRHLGHFDFFGQDETDGAANDNSANRIR